MLGCRDGNDLSRSLEIKKRVMDDAQQRRLKSMLMEELNSFFRSRNENSLEEGELKVETSNFFRKNLHRVSPIASDKQIAQQTTINHQGNINQIVFR